jgi:hypothetical protein
MNDCSFVATARPMWYNIEERYSEIRLIREADDVDVYYALDNELGQPVEMSVSLNDQTDNGALATQIRVMCELSELESFPRLKNWIVMTHLPEVLGASRFPLDWDGGYLITTTVDVVSGVTLDGTSAFLTLVHDYAVAQRRFGLTIERFDIGQTNTQALTFTDLSRASLYNTESDMENDRVALLAKLHSLNALVPGTSDIADALATSNDWVRDTAVTRTIVLPSW